MDSITLQMCAAAARAALRAHVDDRCAQHTSGNALMPLAMGDDMSLVACFSYTLRQLPRAGLGEAAPELSDEQIERAALAASVAVERVLGEAVLAVEDEANGAIGLHAHGDAHEQVVTGSVGHDPQGATALNFREG